MWVKAITIGNGFPKTRAQRSPEEQKAWADRVRRVEARAFQTMFAQGAELGDLARNEHGTFGGDIPDSLRNAARTFFETLSAEQKEAMRPASRYGAATHGTVVDLFEGLHATADDHVLCYDEFVPIAEIVWPES